jgi:trehalose 2-sulfotransferase
VIRRLLGRPLDWRFGAVIARLDSLADRAERLSARIEGIDGRVVELTATFEQLLERAAGIPEIAERTSSMHRTLKQRIEPLLRTVVDEEPENRRRLHALRASPGYEDAYDDPDPLVSITVPTRGRERLLTGRALPSLLSQTHTNLEVLVVGDAVASEVERAVLALGDPRVRYANLSQRVSAHPDARRHWLVGSTMARNEAARRARGRWLLHFDDDDHLRPDAIASLLQVAREQRAEVAYGGFDEHHPDGGMVTGLGFPPRLGYFSWAGALVHGGLGFFERELIAAHLEMPGDMYMLARMLRVGVRFAMLDEVVLDYFPSTLWERSDPAVPPPTPTAAHPSEPESGRAASAQTVTPDLERLASRPPRSVPRYLGPEYDNPIQSRSGPLARSYVVCSTPRSGSGLLCRGLAGIGPLGVPLEYFNALTREPLSERWQCGSGLQPYLDALHARRVTHDGLFGVKVHWDQMSLVRAEAGAGTNDHYLFETPDALLDRLFPAPLFIRIVRMDLDRQAVSYWKALNSTVWSSHLDEPAGAADAETPYSFEGIDRCRRLIESGEHCWERLIRARGGGALLVTYEELAQDFVHTMERVVNYISPGLAFSVPAPRTRQLSDARSAELLERFRSERASSL